MPSMKPDLERRVYWRSIAQQTASQPCAAAGDEFVAYQPPTADGPTRRQFMSIMAAALGLAGLTLTGCRRWPEQEILPFSARPEGTAPGEALWYATMLERDGVATGVRALCYDGRPIKLEGNPAHPDSLGATDAITQANVLDLYDPDRSRAVLVRRPGDPKPQLSDWRSFTDALRQRLAELEPTGGEGLVIVAPPSASPTITRLRAQLEARYPRVMWCSYAPLHRDNEVRGSVLAFRQPLRTHPDTAATKVLACFDADLLGSHPAKQRLARGWASGRDSADSGEMNRLYVVESAMTLTGSAADHRLPLAPSMVGQALARLAQRLGIAVPGAPLATQAEAWIEQLATDLLANRGAALVTVGPAQPAAVHAMAHAVNARIEAFGNTVHFTEEPDKGRAAADLASVQQRIDAGEVHTLVMLDGNPVFDGGLRFETTDGQAVPGKVGWAAHLGLSYNESSARATWHLPRPHELECWGDGRAWDGTISVQQPMILPLYG